MKFVSLQSNHLTSMGTGTGTGMGTSTGTSMGTSTGTSTSTSKAGMGVITFCTGPVLYLFFISSKVAPFHSEQFGDFREREMWVFLFDVRASLVQEPDIPTSITKWQTRLNESLLKKWMLRCLTSLRTLVFIASIYPIPLLYNYLLSSLPLYYYHIIAYLHTYICYCFLLFVYCYFLFFFFSSLDLHSNV